MLRLKVLLVFAFMALYGPMKTEAQTQLSMDPNQWVVGTCPGSTKPTATGDGGIQFAFPPPPGCVGTLTFNFKHPVAISGTLTSTLKMQVDAGVTFSPADFGNNGTTPATTRFVLFAQGWDKHRTCPVGSDCASQRWYAHSSTDVDPATGANTRPTAYPLANGSATLSKPITPGSGSGNPSDPDNCHWTNVYGECADSDVAHIAAFNSAISQIVRLDQGFGAGWFFEHGVVASRYANFQLYSLGWQ